MCVAIVVLCWLQFSWVCNGTLNGWRTDGRTPSLFLFPVEVKKRKTTHDGTFIAVFYVFLFKFIRTNERMNQSIAVLYLHHHFTPSPPPRPLSSFTHPSALLIVVLFVRVVVFTQLRPQWWKSSCLAHDFHSTNGGGCPEEESFFFPTCSYMYH